jgi:hypothetical protein
LACFLLALLHRARQPEAEVYAPPLTADASISIPHSSLVSSFVLGYSKDMEQAGGKVMARMTDEEADALDELWTRTTPEIDTIKPGFLTRKGFTMVSLDPVTATYLQAKSSVSHHSPSEIIGELVRRDMAAVSV